METLRHRGDIQQVAEQWMIPIPFPGFSPQCEQVHFGGLPVFVILCNRTFSCYQANFLVNFR